MWDVGRIAGGRKEEKQEEKGRANSEDEKIETAAPSSTARGEFTRQGMLRGRRAGRHGEKRNEELNSAGAGGRGKINKGDLTNDMRRSTRPSLARSAASVTPTGAAGCKAHGCSARSRGPAKQNHTHTHTAHTTPQSTTLKSTCRNRLEGVISRSFKASVHDHTCEPEGQRQGMVTTVCKVRQYSISCHATQHEQLGLCSLAPCCVCRAFVHRIAF